MPGKNGQDKKISGGQQCGICKLWFKGDYLGGIRDTTGWNGFIICGKCYNAGHDTLNGVELPQESKAIEYLGGMKP